MKALVYHGPGQRGWDTVADPTLINQTDIVVRVDTPRSAGATCTSSRAESAHNSEALVGATSTA
ncbi:MAG TPA: hypothetical protein VIC06_03545 [Solirubrobacteraceae bacterium]|jgi:hypothetical protein